MSSGSHVSAATHQKPDATSPPVTVAHRNERFAAQVIATLKRLYREKDRVRLQPANATMQPIYVDPDQLRVQGKVVSVVRYL